MSDCIYFVDNNALSRLTRKQRSSAFFAQSCRIPTEVLEEASGFPDVDRLRKHEYKTGVPVLKRLIEVMQTVPTGDIRLLDLYANKGRADPIIVACALDARDNEMDTLLPRPCVVVTHDAGVRDKAVEFGFAVETSEHLAARIEAALQL